MLSFVIFFVFTSTCAADTLISKCASARCAQITPETCINETLAYVPSDGVNHCCDRCVKVKDIVEPMTCDPNICPRVFCIPSTYDKCSANQVLVPSDQLCFCCDACAFKIGGRKCPRNYCEKIYATGKYRDANPEKCLSQGLAFVPRDFDCACFDSCQNINDVTDPIACFPEICVDNFCTAQTIKDCNARQVLVPAGPCYCCDTCVDKINVIIS